MASHRDDAVLPGEEDLDSSSQEDDEDDVDEDEDDDENDDVSPSTSSAGNDAVPVPLPVSVAVASSSSASAAAVTVALPAIPNGEAPATPILAATALISADPDRRGLIDLGSDVALVAPPEEKKPVALDDSRKLFQRLWTDEDEIELLQGFLDYTGQRGNKTTHHHGQNDTALFYDQIKSKLQLEFNKNQLVEKLRRLKKKYRNVLNKISSGKDFSFKSPHDQATFEISRKIWTNLGAVDTAMDDDDPSPSLAPHNFILDVKGEDSGGFAFERRIHTPAPMAAATPTPRSRKRSRPKSDPRIEERRFVNENSAPNPTPIKEFHSNHSGIGHSSSNNGNVQGMIEEAVRSCMLPVIKELMSSAMGGPCAPARGLGGLATSPAPFSLGGVSVPPMNLGLGMIGELAAASFPVAAAATDERWRKQQILELEVYSKRLELVQDQIKAALEDLRSRGGSSQQWML